MLGISLYKDKIFFLRTEKSKKEFSVTNYGSRSYKNFNQLISNSAKDIIKNEKINNEDTISYIIDSQFCSFNEIYCEDSNSLDFHNNLSGASNMKAYLDSYYYPIGSRDDHFLGVHVEKGLKKKILSSVEKLNVSIRSIGVGIFSAEMLARFVFKAHSLDNYLILRFITSGALEVLYVDDGLLSVYARYSIVNKNLKPMKVIGSRKNEDKIRLNILKLLKGTTKIANIDKTFVYQTSGQSPIVKNIISKNPKNISLLNIFNHSDHRDEKAKGNIGSTMNEIRFSELGQLFGGLNV